MKNKVEEYNSSIMDDIFESIDPKEKEKTRQKMLLASKIEDAMKAKGWNKTKLLKAMKQKNASVATKWFSGTHNFTIETLIELQDILGVNLLNTSNNAEKEVVIQYNLVVQQSQTNYHSTDLGRILGKQENKIHQGMGQINNFHTSMVIE